MSEHHSQAFLLNEIPAWLFLWQGTLKGFDQATNVILDDSHERVYSTEVRICVHVRLLMSQSIAKLLAA